MKKILASDMGHNSITNGRKIMYNNINLDLVDIIAYMRNLVNFLSNYSEDIKRN